MSTNSYYIKVEAVNIYAHLGDTNQLSVIRGGSLLLKKAIEEIANRFFTGSEERVVSTGASSGFFRTPAPDKSQTIRDWLNRESGDYCDFTFVVDQVQADSFQEAKEKLIALGRMRQMQQVSVSCDRLASTDTNLGASELSGVRVATDYVTIKGREKNEVKKVKVSAFDKTRFEYGRDQRSQLYNDELAALSREGECATNDPVVDISPFGFTHTLNTLAGYKDAGNLDNKMAVIYLDGNDFGAIQRQTCHGDEEQEQFDRRIKSLRRCFLNTLLTRYRDNLPASDAPNGYFHFESERKKPGDRSFQRFANVQARLETLLWGGDEMTLIAPAWLGFDILTLFYRTSAEWQVNKKRLTHAGGLVFCNRKTPVFRIRALAQDLAEAVKATAGGREGNFFDYLVLESVDYPTGSLAQHLAKTYGATLARCRPPHLGPGKGSSWGRQTVAIDTLFEGLPRTQLYQLVAEMRAGFDRWDAPAAEVTAESGQTDQTLAERQHQQVNVLWDTLFERERRLCRFTDAGIIQQFDHWVSDFFNTPLALSTIKSLSATKTLPGAGGVDAKPARQHPARIDISIEALAKRVWVYIYVIELWDYLLPLAPPVAPTKEGKPNEEPLNSGDKT